MKYFEKIADLEELVEKGNDILSRFEGPKAKIVQNIAKENWEKKYEQLKDLIARKHKILKKKANEIF